MKFKFLSLICGLFFCSMVQAALLNIVVTKDRNDYMIYEPIRLRILLQNNAGNPLEFNQGTSLAQLKGELRDKLMSLPPQEREAEYNRLVEKGILQESNFSVEILIWDTKARTPIPSSLSLNAVLQGLAVLGTGESKESREIVLNRYVRTLNKPGDYAIEVRLTHKRLGRTVFRSNRLNFSVLGGRVVRKLKVGTPTFSNTSVIEERYGILQQTMSSEDPFYFFQIQDKTKNYRTTRLANVINHYEPSLYSDAMSNFHLLFMSSPSLYEYRVYTYEGKLLIRNFYKPGSTTPGLISEPRLIKDIYGEVNVINAIRAIEGKDYTLIDQAGSDVPAVR